MNKYGISIFWNLSDEAFVAEMPELKGCIAHGETQEDALHQVSNCAGMAEDRCRYGLEHPGAKRKTDVCLIPHI